MGGELVESENIPIPEGWSVIYMHRTLTERPRRILHSARPTKAWECQRTGSVSALECGPRGQNFLTVH